VNEAGSEVPPKAEGERPEGPEEDDLPF
jgi:hypothetical protein